MPTNATRSVSLAILSQPKGRLGISEGGVQYIDAMIRRGAQASRLGVIRFAGRSWVEYRAGFPFEMRHDRENSTNLLCPGLKRNLLDGLTLGK